MFLIYFGDIKLFKPRLSIIAMSALLLLMPLSSHAATLGQLRVLSSLGQAFQGEIDIMGASAEELSSLSAQLAKPEAYNAAQLAYPASSLGFTFTISKRSDQQVIALVSSARAIDEPVINLVVALNWQGGSAQRAYTTLIDPAGFSAPANLPISPVESASPASFEKPNTTGIETKTDNAVSTDASPAPVQASATPQESKQTEYRIKKGDTLNAIAKRFQSTSVHLDQVLLALYQANQHAFSGNMSRMKSGKILHIPDAAEIEKIDIHAAQKTVRVHSKNWQQYRQQLAKLASGNAENPVSEEKNSGRISPKMQDPATKEQKKEKDVLKIAQNGSSPSDLEEENAARQKALEEAQQRVLELQKNIKNIEKALAEKNK